MSYKTSSEGNLYLKIPECDYDQLVAEILKGYRDLLIRSMDCEAERYMIDGYLESYQVTNVRDNLVYLSSIDTILEYIEVQDAE